jgi:hypothetical protein
MAVGDRQNLKKAIRQVKDLPRISMAEPFGEVAVLTVMFLRSQRLARIGHGPNRFRYSLDEMNALTISAAM